MCLCNQLISKITCPAMPFPAMASSGSHQAGRVRTVTRAACRWWTPSCPLVSKGADGLGLESWKNGGKSPPSLTAKPTKQMGHLMLRNVEDEVGNSILFLGRPWSDMFFFFSDQMLLVCHIWVTVHETPETNQDCHCCHAACGMHRRNEGWIGWCVHLGRKD